MRCLAKEPGERPQSGAELVSALESASMSSAALSAASAMLLPGRRTLIKALGIYVSAFLIVAVLAKVAITGIGLPDWVFPGALLVMALGLPAILFTAYAQYVARRTASATSTDASSNVPAATSRPRGSVKAMALKASPHLTFRRATIAGAYVGGAFVLGVGTFMVLRAMGIGPSGSLMAAGKLGVRERVILAEFKGPPTDSLLGPTVTEAFRTDIAQSSNLSIVPTTTVRNVLLRMQRPATERVDYAVAREVATREGIKALLDGEIVSLGGSYVLSARLVTASTGDEIASFRETAGSSKELIPAISRLTKSIRSRIGESLRTVQNAPTLEAVTTPSLEALRKYVAGATLFDNDGDFDKGVTLLEEAIALDSGFAMAYRRLAVELNNRGVQKPRQQELVAKAYAHRDRLSASERALTIAAYYEFGPQLDRKKVVSAYESLLEIDPDNITALNNLSTEYNNLRDFAKAEQLLAHALVVQPGLSLLYLNLAGMQMNQGKYDDAERTLQRFAKAAPQSPTIANSRGQLASDRGNIDIPIAIADSLRQARPNDANTQFFQAQRLAGFAFLRGQLKQGLRYRTELRTRNIRAGNRQAPLNLALDEPEVDVLFRNQPARALQTIQQALVAHPLDSIPLVVRPYDRLVWLYSLAGRPDLAKSMQGGAARQAATLDASDAEAELHNIAGMIAIAERRYTDAVREYRATDVGACVACALPDIAHAYDLAGNRDSALVVFDRYVHAPNRPLSTDLVSLAGAHKRLGELYEDRGDRAKAATEYTAFVELWKNADAELQPLVVEVRKRLARLSAAEGRV
jgi:tetratricopeptide (TPR) repeat protein